MMALLYQIRSPVRGGGLPSHDALVRLASADPEAFEALRHQLIEDLINRAPESARLRLRGIQYRVEAIRSVSSSPLGATVKIYDLMRKSFLLMDQRLQELVAQSATLPLPAIEPLSSQRPTKRTATVIGFPLRARRDASHASFAMTPCMAE